jgi:hypothetical protein
MVALQLLSSAMWHGATSYKHINILPPASSDVMWLNNSCRETTLATVTCHKALIHISWISKWSHTKCDVGNTHMSCNASTGLQVALFRTSSSSCHWSFRLSTEQLIPANHGAAYSGQSRPTHQLC